MSIQILLSFLFFGVVAAFALKYRDGGSFRPTVKTAHVLLISLLGAALLLRLILGITAKGFETDIALFKAWGKLCNDIGYGQVYFQDQVYLDYPPGYLYVLSWLDGLRSFFNLPSESSEFMLLIKMPPILADLATALLLYRFSAKKLTEGAAVFLAGAYLFCPAVLINSAVWGQIDSCCTLLLFVSLYLLDKGKVVPAAILYGVSIAVKPQLLIYAPVYLFFTLYRKNWKGMVLGVVSAVLAIMVIATPFVQDWNYLWLIEKYKATMDYYAYYTVNAYNIWALFGLNWGALPVENGLLLFVLNWGGPILATALCGLFMWKVRVRASIYAAAGILMSTVFLFSVKMHERYLFSALFFILICYILVRDKRWLWLFAGFSTVHYLNVSYVLYLDNAYVDPFSFEIILLSALHLALYGYFIYLCFVALKPPVGKVASVVVKRKEKVSPLQKAEIPLETTVAKRLTRTDYVAVGAITVLYALVAFWHLGSNTTANTSWLPVEGESVVLEIAGEYNAVYFLPGIAKKEGDNHRTGTHLRLETSVDGITWEEAVQTTQGEGDALVHTPLDLNDKAVYEWHALPISNGKPFVRLTALDGEVVLNEIAFKEPGTEYFQIIRTEGYSPLCDEQNIVPSYPSYYNSTYFDEIYHARTAYEHVLGSEIYENTHPPLGKLIISVGIRMFGMNPFGWRFMGALFGVLMLPVFYHIIKRLFGCTFLAAAGTLLFAFDFMHFAQTRIATIDTYAVFFILLMYDAMLVFCQKDFMKSSKRALLLPLALSGVFMGLGAASKWTCIYAAAGLAVLLFYRLIREGIAQKWKDDFMRRALGLAPWCLLFFVVIPFALYFIAFLPLTLLPHNRGDVFGTFLSYQTHMFNYHSGLVASHPYASPWYEWPLDMRNIFFYITNNYEGTGALSTISSFGNPLLWWAGLAGMVGAVWFFVRKKAANIEFMLVGFLASYLPWVLVSRCTFVYHYFTAVPFIIMALLLCFYLLMQRAPFAKGLGKGGTQITRGHVLVSGFVVLCIVLFVFFFPVISGAPTTSDYANGLEWLPNWVFA